MRLPRHIALCLPLLLPCAAQADDIGPAQAQALQQQLKDWFAGLLGPTGTTPDLSLRITGEGDHYRMTWPIPGLDDPGAGAAVTAAVRPLDGGRWAIDGIMLPPTASLTMTLPDTGDPATGGPQKATFAVGHQDSQALIDPALAGPSTLHLDLGNVAITTDGAKRHQEQRIGRYLVETSLKPARNDRLDAVMDATIEEFETASRADSGPAVAVGAQKAHAVGRIDGLRRDRTGGIIAAMAGFLRALPPDVVQKHGRDDLPPPARAQLHALIEALPDLLNGVRLDETVDGLQVEVAGIGGLALHRLLLGFGGEAPGGNLRAWAALGLDGLESPSLPPTLAAYLPHHLELRPSLSGIRTEDLAKLALDASEPDLGDDRLSPDIAAIFAHGPVEIAMEALSFDLGPAKVEGLGKLVVAAADSWRGEARLSATGFDDLTAQARKDPALKQALPVLMMLGGLAKPDGDRKVWDIASDGTAMTVNGLDLSGLAGDKPKTKQPNGPQGQPRRR